MAVNPLEAVGGAIMKFIGVDPIGMIDKVGSTVAQFVDTPDKKNALTLALEQMKHDEALAQMKRQQDAAQMAHEERMAAFSDTASARDMANKSGRKTQDRLAVVIVVSFFVLVAFILWVMQSLELTSAQQNLIFTVFGAVSSGFMLVLGFYFGSSAGSQHKNFLLSAAQATSTTKDADSH